MTFTDTPNPNQDQASAITAALRAAPDLYQAPGVAVGAASTPDPAGNAQALAQTSNTAATSQAYRQVQQKGGGGNWLEHAVGWLGAKVQSAVGLADDVPGGHTVKNDVGAALSKGLSVLSIPLRDIQHQYRYIRDVQATHGTIPGLLEGLGIAAGAALGGTFGGEHGAVLGGEAASTIESRLLYHDSWKRTANGDQYLLAGKKVSIGRDLANVLGLKYGTTPYNIVSGVSDGIGDLTLDPLQQMGSLGADARGAEGAAGMLGQRFGGTAIQNAEDVERVYNQYGSVRKAFGQLAEMTPGDIVADPYYGKNFGALAPQLGAASTPDEVADVFRNFYKSVEMTSNTLPSMTFTRVPMQALYNAANNYEGIGSGITKAFTNYLPTSFDPETLRFSNKEFDPNSNFATRGIYQVVRFGQSADVAKQVATDFANETDPAQRILTYKNAVIDMLRAKGLTEENSAFLRHEVEQLTGGSNVGQDAIYGLSDAGRNISKVVTDTGKELSAGILENHTGNLAFPDFNAITREVRSLNSAKNLYGAADDWVYNKFTQGVFKKLVLLSGGFAQRIAAAEAIPGALKEGTLNIIKDGITARAAQWGLRASEDDASNTAAVLSRMYGGAAKLLNVNPTDLADTADNVLYLGGQTVSPAIRTDAAISGEVGGKVEKVRRDLYNATTYVPRAAHMGETFGTFGVDSSNQADYWQRWLSEISNSDMSQKAAEAYLAAAAAGRSAEDASAAGAAAATDWINQQPDSFLNKYVRHTVSSTPGIDPHEDWGRVVMENIKGATTGMDGTVHIPIIRDIANGERTSRDALDAIDNVQRPILVKGREVVPDTTSTIDRIANYGFRRVLDPIINHLSREPIYNDAFLTQYQPLKALVESGDLSKAEALQLANVRATHAVIPFIHNTMERSQFAELARNFMPFYFAQEQAYRRFGHLLADDPGAFRQMQLAISMLHDVGSNGSDPNGQSFMIYPGTGFLGRTVPNILNGMGIPTAGSVPVSFSGQLKSLNTVFPFSEGVRPSFGPVVAIPAHLLMNFMPESKALEPIHRATNAIVGDQALSGSIWDQLIPNTFVKRAIQTFAGDHSRSFQNAQMYAIQSLAHQQDAAMAKWTAAGHSPDDPGAPQIVPKDTTGPEWQTFMDRVKNQTRIVFGLKALIGLVSPMSPVSNIGDSTLRSELSDLVKKNGISQGVQQFLAAHPDATADTVFLTDNTSGANLPANRTAQDWVDNNLDAIKKFPHAGAWFIPQDATGKFNQQVYNEQLAQHLRVRKAPEQFMKDLYVAAGNAQFYNHDLPAYKSALAQAADDPTATQSIKANFANYLTTFGKQNPIWWDDFKSADRDHQRQLAADELEKMYDTNQMPDSPMTADLKGLIEDYKTFKNTLTVGRQDAYAVASRKTMLQNWQAYMDQLAKEKPQLQAVISKVFRPLQPQVPAPTVNA